MSVKTIRNNIGLTLIELVAVIAITAIIAAVAVPSMSHLVNSNQATTAANSIASGFATARSQAVSQNTTVSIRSAGSSFLDGWCIYTGDYDKSCGGSRSRESGSFEASGMSIEGFSSGRVAFNANGVAETSTPTISMTLVPDECASKGLQNRRIVIDQTGRAEVERIDC